jgi:hypothetical protein
MGKVDWIFELFRPYTEPVLPKYKLGPWYDSRPNRKGPIIHLRVFFCSSAYRVPIMANRSITE